MSDPEVEVTTVPLVRSLRPGSDLRALREIRRLIRSWHPDIVHTHQAKAGAIARIAVALSRRKPVTVHTFHGHVLEGYFGPIAKRIFLAAERRLARRTTALVAVSRQVQDDLIALEIGKTDQWRVIPLGFELEPFLEIRGHSSAVRPKLGLGPDARLVGVFGRVTAIKDHATLIDAISTLDGVHLAIFGDGELIPDIEEQIRSLGVADRVHIMGWWSDVAAAIADMDVVALTSRSEGTPVSLIEALAAGKPVVATDVGGVRDVVVDGVSGLVVPPASPNAVAAALKRLLWDASSGVEMGAAGRAWVAERFAWPRLVEDTRTLYAALLSDT
jgi:glycosyltransferase involved in cell wall biosynthesis